MRRRWSFGVRLCLITIVGFAVRMVYARIRFQHFPMGGDASFYANGANLLVQGHGFIDPLSLATGHAKQSAIHPPLYLLYLAFFCLIDPRHFSPDTSLVVWSSILGTATVVVVGLAGREIAGKRVGLIAAFLAAVYPNLWVNDGMLLSETMAIFITSLLILLAYRAWNRPSGWRIAWLGFACGLAALTRAELILCLPFIVVPILLFTKGVDRKRKLKWMAGSVAAFAVVVGPWVNFNMTRFHERVFISADLGATLAAANCHSTYFTSNIGFKDYGCGHEAAVRSFKPGIDTSEQNAALQKEGIRYIKKHIKHVPVVMAVRVLRIAELYHPHDDVRAEILFAQREKRLASAELYSYYVVAVLAIAGGIFLKRRGRPVFPLAAFVVIVIFSVAITFAQTRYRAPCEAALALLAAVAIDEAWGWWRARRAGVAASATNREDDRDAMTVPV